MGIEAEEQDVNTDELTEEQKAAAAAAEAGQEERPGEQTAEEEESVEIVHADDSPASDDEGKKPKGPPRRIRKLLERNQRMSDEAEAREAENRLLRMQLERLAGTEKKDAPKEPPTLESCGYDEQKYQQAVADYYAGTSRSLIGEELKKLATSQQQEQYQRERKSAIEAHYERADKLKVPDYDDAEAKAVEVLGRETVEDIAAQADDSELLVYYLGKNPAKAEEIANLVRINPVKATFALGKLASGLSVRGKTTKTQTPDPDSPESAGGGSGGSWEKRLEKAREKAAQTGDMSHVQRLKKEARAAGVNL